MGPLMLLHCFLSPVPLTFPISPLCHVQTFQTPCICLHSHISPGFPSPNSYFHLFQASPPARQGLAATPLAWTRLAAFPFHKLWFPRELHISLSFSTAPVLQPQDCLSKLGFLCSWNSGTPLLDYCDYLLRTTDSCPWRHDQ